MPRGWNMCESGALEREAALSRMDPVSPEGRREAGGVVELRSRDPLGPGKWEDADA